MKANLSLLIVLILVAAACSSRDSSVTSPPKNYSAIESDANLPHIKVVEPNVDFRFIVDDSKSMEHYQDLLSQGVGQFVDAIVKVKQINLHFGVSRIWDSGRYIPQVMPPVCEATGQVNYVPNGNGALLPVNATNNPAFQGKNFISRQDGFEKVLADTIKINVPPFIAAPDATHPCASGPEIEEVLTPIVHSFDPDKLAGPDKDFWRRDSFKVFVILSDAKEGSRLTAEEVDRDLRIWTGAPLTGPQDRFRVYAVTILPNTRVTEACKPDPGFALKLNDVVPDHEIAKLATLSGGKLLSICSPDYGPELAKFGEQIKKDTLHNVHQALQYQPNVNNTIALDKKLHVVFDFDENHPLQMGTLQYPNDVETVVGGDWAYDSKHNMIVIKGDLDVWIQHPDAQIKIVYVPVGNPGDPRVKKI